MKVKTILLSLLAGICAGAIEYPIGRASNITMDGKLDEPCWKAANVINDFTLMKASGKSEPRNRTEAIMLTDDEALYFGFKCYSKYGVVDNLKGEVTNAWTNDLVEIFIAPTASRDEYYQFAITAGGAYWSQFFAEAGNIRPDPYKPGFQVAASRTDEAYVLEVRFPYNAFYMTSAAQFAKNWAINMARYDIGKPDSPGTENSTWAKLAGSFHEVKKYNTVSGLPAKPRKFDLLIPTVTFSTMGKKDSGYTGNMNVEVFLFTAPEGKYTLETMGQTVGVELKTGSNGIVLPATFEKDGRTPVKLLLKNAQGEVVSERSYPVYVDSTAYAIEFTSPQYGGNFYPGEDAKVLSGSIKVNTGDKEVVLKVAGKNYKLPVIDGVAPFSVDVSRLRGDINVSVGDVNLVVKHVNDALAWIRDGKIVVNGLAEYRLGWYGGIGWITSKAVQEKYPTMEAKMPLSFPARITLDPGRLLTFEIEKKELVFDKKPCQELLDAIRKAIEKSQDSSDYVYYLSDEPECRGLSPIYLRHLYKYIKALDPRRLVMIISRDPVRYIDCCDIINPHPYIRPSVFEDGTRQYGVTLAQLRDSCASVEKLNRPDKALMLTPQVHSYSFNNIYADYPTFDENNVSIWTSVVHGGQGITPYIWYDHLSRPSVDLGCDFVYTSLHRLSYIIANGQRTRLPGDEGCVFTLGDKQVYVICNVHEEKGNFTFKTQLKKLYRFRHDSTFRPNSRGEVKLSLKPFEVVILTSEKMDTGLSTEAQVKKDVEAAEYARTHRGNLLFGKARTISLNYPPSEPYDRQNTLEQQDKMFDGNCETSAWIPLKLKEKEAWYEMEFTAGAETFSTARIYGFAHQDLTFKVWEGQNWVEPTCVRQANGKYELILSMKGKVTASKVRLEFKGNKVELYEFELLK